MRRILSAVASLAILLATSAASAAIAVHTYNFEYSGGTPPAGSPPWLRATFDDGGSAGSVSLTLTTPNLVGSEFVNGWYFNLNPALNPTNLNFSVQSTSGLFAVPAIATGANAFSAAGNTLFDILIDFSNAPPGARFGPGNSIEYLITGIPTLTADSFSFFSVPGGLGPFISVAKVQSIAPDDGGGWVAFVPEPALGAVAIPCALLWLRRRA